MSCFALTALRAKQRNRKHAQRLTRIAWLMDRSKGAINTQLSRQTFPFELRECHVISKPDLNKFAEADRLIRRKFVERTHGHGIEW